MIKKLFLLMLFISNITYAQLSDIVVDKKYYTVTYSQEYQQPKEVKYILYLPTSNVSRKGYSFYKEPGIVTSDDFDYANNDYDKGHLFPAEAASSSPESMKSSFSYLNCAMQHYELNRGLWRILEDRERTYAQTERIVVTIKMIFPSVPIKTINGTVIPIAFEKRIYFSKTKYTLIYRFPNKKCNGTIEDYLVK